MLPLLQADKVNPLLTAFHITSLNAASFTLSLWGKANSSLILAICFLQGSLIKINKTGFDIIWRMIRGFVEAPPHRLSCCVVLAHGRKTRISSMVLSIDAVE